MTIPEIGQPAAKPNPSAARAGERARARALWLLLLGIGYYAFLLTGLGSIGLFVPVTYGRTFNSMLLHLLQGRFDVDPAAIGREGYLRDGAVYAYFGIVPALIRAPFLLLRDFAETDFTRVSCLLAASLMALFKTLSALSVWRGARTSRHSALLGLFIATLLFSGAQGPVPAAVDLPGGGICGPMSSRPLSCCSYCAAGCARKGSLPA